MCCFHTANVKLEEVNGLVQDAIFSRGPSGVKRTGIFIGGRDIWFGDGHAGGGEKSHGTPICGFRIGRSIGCLHYGGGFGGKRGKAVTGKAWIWS